VDVASVLALSVGLAMDAMAVSAARGLAAPRLRARHFVTVAGFFGGFQAAMPLGGWLLGKEVGPYVAAWAHWIAFALLAGIGLKMLLEARKGESLPEGATERELFGVRVMLVLAVATSIDAFAAGLTLPLIDAPPALSLASIGITTGALSALGLWAGRRFGALFGRRLDAFGGLVLVGLGVKILLERLASG
jgi:putative Mn2+ efflux pump MntP